MDRVYQDAIQKLEELATRSRQQGKARDFKKYHELAAALRAWLEDGMKDGNCPLGEQMWQELQLQPPSPNGAKEASLPVEESSEQNQAVQPDSSSQAAQAKTPAAKGRKKTSRSRSSRKKTQELPEAKGSSSAEEVATAQTQKDIPSGAVQEAGAPIEEGNAIFQEISLLEEDANVSAEGYQPEPAPSMSPEIKVIQARLSQARQELVSENPQDWKRALQGLDSLDEKVKQGPMADEISNVRVQAADKLNGLIHDKIQAGNEALAAGNMDEAQTAYLQIQELEKDNEDAQRGLAEITGRNHQSVDEWFVLKRRLEEANDVNDLGKLVYQAEAFYQQGKLPEDLVTSMRQARQRYDDLRVGIHVSMMASSELHERKEAVDFFSEKIRAGKLKVTDIVTGKVVETQKLLDEANKEYQALSASIQKSELEKIQCFLPAEPDIAITRLQTALKDMPFHRNQVNTLKSEIKNLEKECRKKEDALAKVNASTEETRPLEGFKRLLEARQVFPHLEGIDKRIEDFRPIAAEALASEIQEEINRADYFLTGIEHTEEERRKEQFSQAREALKTGADLLGKTNRWPEKGNLPVVLKTKKDACEKKLQEFNEREELFVEFDLKANQIRALLKNPDKKHEGLKLYEDLTKDSRFTNLAGFNRLRVEIEAISKWDDLWQQIQNEQAMNHWEQVQRLGRKMLQQIRSGTVQVEGDEDGHIVKERETILKLLVNEADLEINAQLALNLLARKEVRQANRLLSTILKEHAGDTEKERERREQMKVRIQEELDTIQTCLNLSKDIRPLYDEAINLLELSNNRLLDIYINPQMVLEGGQVSPLYAHDYSSALQEVSASGENQSQEKAAEGAGRILSRELQRRAATERAQALRIFKYVGGMAQSIVGRESQIRDWAPLTLYTVDAVRMVNIVRISLRNDFIAPIVKMYDQRSRVDARNEDEYRKLAEQARLMREERLLESESERQAVRWVEVEWGVWQAHQKQEQGLWQEALLIWQDLNRNHPHNSSIEQGLRMATIQGVLLQARLLRENEDPQSALEALREVQNRPQVGRSWQALLEIARIQGESGNFEGAFEALREAATFPEAEEEVKELKNQYHGLKLERETLEQVDEYLREAAAVEASAEKDTDQALRAEERRRGAIKQALSLLHDTLALEENAGSEVLQKKMREIFILEQDRLLDYTRTASKVSAQDSQNKVAREIQSIMALMDLKKLEDLAYAPPEARQSMKRLPQYYDDLPLVVEVLCKDIDTFDPVANQLQLNEAINRAEQLIARCHMMEEMRLKLKEEKDRFPLKKMGSESDYQKLLIKTVTQLNNQQQTMDAARKTIEQKKEALLEIEGALRRACIHDRKIVVPEGQPDPWKNAIRTLNFDSLAAILKDISGSLYETIQDISDFNLRLEEWEEVSLELMEHIDTIRDSFEKEDFSRTIELIRGTRVRPATRNDTQSWGWLSYEEYQDIREWLSNHLVVSVHHDEGEATIRGWQEVQEASQTYEEEYQQLKNWWDEFDTAYFVPARGAKDRALPQYLQAPGPYDREEAASGWICFIDTPTGRLKVLVSLRTWRQQWEDVKEKTERALQYYDTHPSFTVHSHKSQLLCQTARQQLLEMKQWLNQAAVKLEEIKTEEEKPENRYPNTQELFDCVRVKNWVKLDQLIRKARQVGSSPERQTELVKYELSLQNGRQSSAGSANNENDHWLDNLFKRDRS